MKFLVILSLFCGLNAGAQLAPSDPAKPTPKIKSVEQRLFELERQQREFNQWYSEYYIQSKDRVSPFLGEKISIGGFFESGITHLSGPDTAAQTSSNSHTLGINIAAEFNDRVRFVTQYLTGLSYTFQNANNNPNLTPTQRQFGIPSIATLVANAYLEYRQSAAFTVQTGLGYAPFGQAFQQREPVLFKRRNGPQMVAGGDATTVGIAFPLWMGLHILGNFHLGEGQRLGYDLYTFTPSTSPKTMGTGGRVWWSDSQNVTVGLSLQGAEQVTNSYYSYGADVDVKLSSFGFVAEFARSVQSGGAESLVTYYIEPYYTFSEGKWLVYGVADYINNPNRTVGAIADNYEKMQFGGGINWLPIPNARFRIGFLNHDYWGSTDSINGQRRDYQSLDFSTGIAF